tara:strand:+ start:545 stop:691 length:147 start_codon:yes stop_codon:yes gene_type:complete
MDKDLKDYTKTFTDKEKIAYKIAEQHLKTSFNVKKSIGYIEHKEKDKK